MKVSADYFQVLCFDKFFLHMSLVKGLDSGMHIIENENSISVKW